MGEVKSWFTNAAWRLTPVISQAATLNTSKAGRTSEEALAFWLLARSAGACVFPHICTVSQLQATAATLCNPHPPIPPRSHAHRNSLGLSAVHMGEVWSSICLIINEHHLWLMVKPAFSSKRMACLTPKQKGNIKGQWLKVNVGFYISLCVRHFLNCQSSHIWSFKHNCWPHVFFARQGNDRCHQLY